MMGRRRRAREGGTRGRVMSVIGDAIGALALGGAPEGGARERAREWWMTDECVRDFDGE